MLLQLPGWSQWLESDRHKRFFFLKLTSPQASRQGVCRPAGLFPRGLPTFQSLEHLKESLPLIDLSYKSFYTLDKFPETYADAKARCAHVARGLAGRHPTENFLMVGHGLSVEYLVS